MSKSRYIKLATSYFHEGKWDLAISNFTKGLVIRCELTDATLYNNRGFAYLQLNKCFEAAEDFKKAIELKIPYEAATSNLKLAKEKIAKNIKDAKKFYLRGNSLFNQKEYAKAAKLFKKAVNLNSKHASYQHMAGRALSKIDCHQKAITYYSNAIQSSPSAPRYLNRGNSYLALGDLDNAFHDFTKAVGLNNQLAVHHFKLGVVLALQDHHNTAIVHYSRAIKINPLTEYYHMRGRSYFKKKNNDKAKYDFEIATVANPTEAEYHHSLGVLKASTGLHKEAAESFLKAVTLTPRRATYHDALADSYINQNEYHLAGVHLAKAIELDSTQAEYHNKLGIVLEKLNLQSDAIVAFTRAIEEDPACISHYKNRANLYLALNKFEEAKTDFLDIIDLDPSSTHYEKLGSILYNNKHYQEAITCFTKAIALDNQKTDSYYYRALCYRMLGNQLNALDDITKAITINAKVGDYFRLRGTIHFNLNNFKEALADYNEVIKFFRSDSSDYHRRGLCFLKLNSDMSAAIQDFNKAIEIDPDNSTYYASRAEAYQHKSINKPGLAFEDQEKAFRLNKDIPPLKDICKFFILNNHGMMMTRNSTRHFIEHTAIKENVTDHLRRELFASNITPDTISMVRKNQGYPLESPTLFDEIRKEEELFLRLGK